MNRVAICSTFVGGFADPIGFSCAALTAIVEKTSARLADNNQRDIVLLPAIYLVEAFDRMEGTGARPLHLNVLDWFPHAEGGICATFCRWELSFWGGTAQS